MSAPASSARPRIPSLRYEVGFVVPGDAAQVERLTGALVYGGIDAM